jgi:hypothetical protein
MFGARKLRDPISRIPFKFWVPIYYLLTFLWVLLLILALPFIFVYRFALSILAWFAMSPGKNIIVVTSGSQTCKSWLQRLMPLIGERGVFLNYEERRNWLRWSLPVRLFHAFGPAPTAQTFIPNYLPAVIIVTKFRRPQSFSFGSLSKDHEVKLEKLRSALAAGRGAKNDS